MVALLTRHDGKLFLFTKFCLLAYLAVLNPRHATIVSQLFFIFASAGTVLLWSANSKEFKRYRDALVSDPLFWGLLVLGVWGLVASLISGFSFHDLNQELKVFRKVMVQGILAYLVITYVCFRQNNVKPILIVLAAVGAITCLDIFMSYARGSIDIFNRDAVKMLLHKNVHVNVISRQLNFLAPFSVIWVWNFGIRRGWGNWLLYMAALLVLLASFFTISRAGWLGAVGGLFFLFVFARRRKLVILLVAASLLIFGLTYGISKDVRMHVAALEQRLSDLSERVPNWKLCLKAVSQRPVWGWGVYEKDTFHRMVRAVDGNDSKILKYPYAHNIFLQIALLWGIPFLLLLLSLFAYIYWKAWCATQKEEFSNQLQWSALVSATVGSFWLNGFFSEIIWPYAFLAIAMASSLKAIESGEKVLKE
jgi:O-antigen ligase